MNRAAPLTRKTPLKAGFRTLGKATAAKRKANPTPAYLKKLFSMIVRARDGYCCHWCLRSPKTSPGLVLHAAHIYSVGAKPHMRYQLENALALCYACHIHRAHRDGGLMPWCDENLPKKRMARLHLSARTGGGKLDLGCIRVYLEAEAAKEGVPLPPPPKL